MIAPLTLHRHTAPVDEVADFWVDENGAHKTPAQVDTDLAAFIEKRLKEHGSLLDINNAMAGVSHFFPPVRGHLREIWRLAGTRQRRKPSGRAFSHRPVDCSSLCWSISGDWAIGRGSSFLLSGIAITFKLVKWKLSRGATRS